MKGNFLKLINSSIPVLIDFHAEWCGPCKAQNPIIKEVASAVKGKARVIKMDVDKNQNIAQQYNVRGVPTLALFKDGQLVWKQSGVHTKKQLLQVLEQYA